MVINYSLIIFLFFLLKHYFNYTINIKVIKLKLKLKLKDEFYNTR